ncbi:M23 family metallopeptidase [Roseovarius nitratireducens]|uniref:M23 family metallopeptidase n=1 Tax=Roseovarius nitratireducens TaxID=2044597 RepID=UPI000CE1DB5E|nr:M23 family metallopeptidase [Roseovarius nitratireducens]
MRRRAAAVLALALCAARPAVAEPPRLSLPLDCDYGRTCVIEDYVDTDPGPGNRDHACGLKSRDDHRGTDFMLPSFAAMRTGVDVLAAAPGTVAATRDGMADTPVTPETRDAIAGRECGNAVRVDHGDGWQTLYCHMRRGSLTVRPGDRVARGDILGAVGLSGLTNAPHLHLGVLHEGRIVDPFARLARDTCDPAPGTGLWDTPLPYTPSGIFTAGFSTAVPEFDAVKSGAARVTLAGIDAPIVLYGHVFYAQPGDRLTLSARGPDGDIFRHEVSLDTPKAQFFRAFGRRAPKDGWPAGAYRGYVRLWRGDTLIATRHADITVRP